VGGDYFDYIRLPDGRIAVVVADVVGHGIAAALLMAKLSAEVRFCLASEARPAAAVMRLNDAMSRSFAERFVTMIMVVLNPATNEAVIVSAGHMAPMHRSANGQLDEPGADLLGLPLGIEPGFEFSQKSIILAAGDLLTLYTDGINECLNASGKMYGIQGIRNIVLGIPGKVTPRDVGKRIVEDVRRFLGDTTQDDDMCLVCFGRT
jgi:serine phosphatase RsbU (regulator of sigma subunit)